MRKKTSHRRPTGRTGRRRTYRRNRRRFDFSKLIAPLLLLFATAVVGAGCYYVLTTPKLVVSHVKVSGTKLANRNVIESDISNRICGKNMLIIRKSDVASRIKSAYPEVSTVNVGRVLPRTVVAKVEERVPYAVFTLTENTGSSPKMAVYWLVDADGVPFHRVDKLPMDLVVIEADSRLGITVVSGKRIANSIFESALASIEECHRIHCKVRKISVDRLGNLCLNMGSDFYVKLGQPVEISKKLATLSKILYRPEFGNGVEYIDVSCSDAPVWKPKQDISDRSRLKRDGGAG